MNDCYVDTYTEPQNNEEIHYGTGFFDFNVGESPHRNWDDFADFDFISAGQLFKYRDEMLMFNPGDIIAARISRYGYVGIGKIECRAKMVKNVRIKGKPLLEHPLRCRLIAENCDDPENSEYACLVHWLRTASREKAKWSQEVNLFEPKGYVRTDLTGHPETIEFIESKFGVNISELTACLIDP